MVFPKYFFEIVDCEKKSADDKSMQNYPLGKELSVHVQLCNEQPHAGRTSIRDVIVMLKWRHHVASQRKVFHVFFK